MDNRQINIEKELLARVSQGDEEAFNTLFHADRAYVTVNIDDLFDPGDPTGSTYKANAAGNGFTWNALSTLFPAMQKFNHNFDGGCHSVSLTRSIMPMNLEIMGIDNRLFV